VSAARLPKDAVLVELKPESLTFETRECLLPGTRVAFALVMEGRSLPLEAPAEACLVVDRDRAGYVFHSRLSLAALADSDLSLIALFIAKGRGSPGLAAPGSTR
jgi:hypothetical protein